MNKRSLAGSIVFSIVVSSTLFFSSQATAQDASGPLQGPSQTVGLPSPGVLELTGNVVVNLHLDKQELLGLQYYAGDDIVLFRLADRPNTLIASSTMISSLGRSYEIVLIKRATPGVAVAADVDSGGARLAISFEPKCSLSYRVTDGGHARLDGIGYRADEEYLYCGSQYRRLLREGNPVDRQAVVDGLGASAPTVLPSLFDNSGRLWFREPDRRSEGHIRVAPGVTLGGGREDGAGSAAPRH